MKSEEFRDLSHGDKIQGPSGMNFIVHNNRKSGEGMVVVVRTEVIPTKECSYWKLVRKHKMEIAAGTYQVTIDRQIK